MDWQGIEGFVGGNPVLRDLLREAGFRCWDRVGKNIDSARERGLDELSYFAYKDEVFKEYLAIDGPWNYLSRQSLPQAKRSAYIDMLVTKHEDGRIPRPPNVPLHVLLDANELAYQAAWLAGDEGRQRNADMVSNREKERRAMAAFCESLSRDKGGARSTIKNFSKQIAAELGISDVGSSWTGTAIRVAEVHVPTLNRQIRLIWESPSEIRAGHFHLLFEVPDSSIKRFSGIQILGAGFVPYTIYVPDEEYAYLTLRMHMLMLRFWSTWTGTSL